MVGVSVLVGVGDGGITLCVGVTLGVMEGVGVFVGVMDIVGVFVGVGLGSISSNFIPLYETNFQPMALFPSPSLIHNSYCSEKIIWSFCMLGNQFSF
jgi:hypothetical protein